MQPLEVEIKVLQDSPLFGDFTVISMSQMTFDRDITHASLALVDQRNLVVRAMRTREAAHGCDKTGKQFGCRVITELIAVEPLLTLLGDTNAITIKVVNHHANALLQKWINGDPTLPSWYPDGGPLHTLAERLAELGTSRVQVYATQTSHSRARSKARAFLASAITALGMQREEDARHHINSAVLELRTQNF